jgi:hypothetical protein
MANLEVNKGGIMMQSSTVVESTSARWNPVLLAAKAYRKAHSSPCFPKVTLKELQRLILATRNYHILTVNASNSLSQHSFHLLTMHSRDRGFSVMLLMAPNQKISVFVCNPLSKPIQECLVDRETRKFRNFQSWLDKKMRSELESCKQSLLCPKDDYFSDKLVSVVPSKSSEETQVGKLQIEEISEDDDFVEVFVPAL